MVKDLQSAIDSYAKKSILGRTIYKPFFDFLISRNTGLRLSYGLTVVLGSLLGAVAMIAAIAFWMFVVNNA